MLLRLLLTFYTCAEICRCHINLPMIQNLIEHLHTTQIVLSLLCQKRDSLVLLEHFSSKYQTNTIPAYASELPYPIPPSYATFVVDANCPGFKQTLIKANEAKLFANPIRWIIYFNGNLTNDVFKDLDILVDSDVTLAVENAEDVYTITKIYKRHVDDSHFVVENIGNWTRGQGFIDNGYEKITYRRRRNLMKIGLNAALVLTNNDSVNHLTDRRDIHIDSIAKVSYVLVNHLADTVNVTLKYSIQSTWGYKDKDSKWSGLIGKLTRKEADIGGTALFLTADRVDVIEYMVMSTPTISHFIFRAPKLSYVSNVFILPFHQQVWLSTCALFFLTTIIFYIVTEWEWKMKEYIEVSTDSTEPEIRNTWTDVVFESFAAFCQQGTASIPYSIAGRVTLMFLLTSFMFLYTSYSANIVALLQSSSDSIRTLQDLLNSRLDIGVHDTVFNRFYFPNTTEPVRRALYTQKVIPPGEKSKFYSLEEGIKRMRKGLFAFHVEAGPGYKVVTETFHEEEKCGLKGIQFLEVQDCWLAIQKNSSYRKMLKVGLLALQENGIQSREVGVIYTKKPPCLVGGSSFVSVGIVDCYSAMVILVGGIMVAILLLILEIYVNHRLRLRRRRQENK